MAVCAAGPGFGANASRNMIMSSTSFIITPTLYREYYPQEKKNKSSLFWFGLGMNIFFGNVIGITQQSLWGRVLDAHASSPQPISYRRVVSLGWREERVGAFFTPTKWFARVLMNAPIQGTIPFFYNDVLPVFEPKALSAASVLWVTYSSFMR